MHTGNKVASKDRITDFTFLIKKKYIAESLHNGHLGQRPRRRAPNGCEVKKMKMKMKIRKEEKKEKFHKFVKEKIVI